MHRFSFRQLLLLAFLLITLLLGAASLRGIYALEDLIKRSSVGAQQAIALSGAAQSLAERTVGLERAARQYTVLGDPAFRQRLDDAVRDASEALARVEAGAVPGANGQAWRAKLAEIQDELSAAPDTNAHSRDLGITAAFRDLEQIDAHLAEQVRRENESRNNLLLAEVEQGRTFLGRQMLAAIVVAVLLALAFGVWLARPLKQLERAIVGLGENRLDEPIDMPGPADLRLLGRRLEWLRLRLVELDADKARFLRHVSHELKTPLAALREGVALLEEGVIGTLSNDQREVARILRQNTVALQNQIEDLLRFNAAAFEARRLVRRRTDLLALIRDRVEQQRLQWQGRKLTVTVSGEALWIEIDPERLGTAFANLLSNAIRFSPPGTTIRVQVRQRPGRASIDIADEGPGIATAERARVFEPFFRGELQPEDAVRGSGIGLSIVQEYIVAHGGQIELLADGPGAHFHIDLPRADHG